MTVHEMNIHRDGMKTLRTSRPGVRHHNTGRSWNRLMPHRLGCIRSGIYYKRVYLPSNIRR